MFDKEPLTLHEVLSVFEGSELLLEDMFLSVLLIITQLLPVLRTQPNSLFEPLTCSFFQTIPQLSLPQSSLPTLITPGNSLPLSPHFSTLILTAILSKTPLLNQCLLQSPVSSMVGITDARHLTEIFSVKPWPKSTVDAAL